MEGPAIGTFHTDKSRTRFNVDYLLKNYCSEDLRTAGVDSLRLNAEVELIPTHTKFDAVVFALWRIPYGGCILADEVPLTDSFERCYVPQVSLSAGVAKLAYAPDSKWEFCSFCPLRNSSQPLDSVKESDLDALKPFAGLLSNL